MQLTGEDSDIRALLRALPTKADMEALPTKVDMEALVLRVEEQHHRDLQEIRSEVHEIDEWLTREEASVGALETRVTQMEKAHQKHQDQMAEMQLHIEDLENRSCCQNLRFRGIPKATGPENLTETVKAIIHKILDGDSPASLEFDRVTGHSALNMQMWNYPVMFFVAYTSTTTRNKSCERHGSRARWTSTGQKSQYTRTDPEQHS